MSTSGVAEYLSIPEDTEANPFALRWSGGGEAVERPDGSTFAFAAEIALFLEGYALVGPLIHFSYVLLLIRRLDQGPGLGSDDLAVAFREAGRPHRNAGALCAWLCEGIPPVPDQPDAREVGHWLKTGPLMAKIRPGSAVYPDRAMPPIGPLAFDLSFLEALDQLSSENLRAWLRHGRPALPDPGERVARAVEALRPASLEGALAAISGRERLAGAMPMVAQLAVALTLPPRRLGHRVLPSGGYADIATRGRPEQILPSQFAVDDVEFLRRFAENELLYFHREEPHAQVTEELVILLDQGVRTWGRVRHALAASAMALGKIAARRGVTLRVASTGTEGDQIDPLAVDSATLGSFWEASDLTPGPAPALGRILEARPERARDVVVLSHPRSVLGDEFSAASRRAGPGTRVFSVAIDEEGAVGFREWRRGAPVKVGDFRVDFRPPEASEGPSPSPRQRDPRTWAGDVEPVGFPFRFGVVHRIDRPLFDFDQGSRWLMLAGHRGMLHAWKVDGSRTEILPRAVVDGEVLEQVEAVLGVAGGFVVGGRIGKALVAAHYDFDRREGRALALGPTFDGRWDWFYSRAAHVVVARGLTYSRAFDLATGDVCLSRESAKRPSTRAIRALEEAANHALPPPWLAIVDEGRPAPVRGRSVRLDRASGEVRLSGETPAWDDFTPVSDGRPSMVGRWVDGAQLRGGVLALRTSGRGRGPGLVLRLFNHPGGVPSRELSPISGDPASFLLSGDGSMIARRLGERQIEVRETFGAGQPLLVTAKGKIHTDPRVTLGRYGIVIQVGKHCNLIRWDRGRLDVSTIAEGSTRTEPAGRSTPRPGLLDYDPKRFVACARGDLTAVVDAFGQVALFDRDDQLLAMFVAFRGQVAAWMPDGTRLGPAHGPSPLIDGPVTPGAAERIGHALKMASDATRVGTGGSGTDLTSS